MNIERLMKKLSNLTYHSKVLGRTETFNVINSENLEKVELCIREFLIDEHDSELGILQAKVKTYEAIIANSNFAPILDSVPKEEE